MRDIKGIDTQVLRVNIDVAKVMLGLGRAVYTACGQDIENLENVTRISGITNIKKGYSLYVDMPTEEIA